MDNRSRQKGEAFSGALGPAAPRNASTQIYSGPRRDRGFESCFLQRGVYSRSGTGIVPSKIRENPRRITCSA